MSFLQQISNNNLYNKHTLKGYNTGMAAHQLMHQATTCGERAVSQAKHCSTPMDLDNIQ